MSLLVTGSIGIDSVSTPHGDVAEVLGGSAVYFSWAAAAFCTVRLVGVVGEDFPAKFSKAFKHPRIDAAGLEKRQGSKTFRWSGRYDATMNEATTTAVDLNVLAERAPAVPKAFADSKVVFLAATHPGLQMELLGQVKKPKLVISDTRDLWIRNYRDELIKSLKNIDGIVLNDAEARLLTGEVNLVKALTIIRKLIRKNGPQVVIVKKGEHGCLVAHGPDIFAMPAFPTHNVLDPTGAGDSFAGGLLGYLTGKGKFDVGTFKQAVAAGTVMASFTIESFSLKGLQNAHKGKVAARLAHFRKMLTKGL